MNEMSTGTVLNGASCIMHDKPCVNGEPSNYISCGSEAVCSLESMMALRNAYSILRDRYNKLKLENLKLTRHIQKYKEMTSTKNSLDSHSDPNDASCLVASVAEFQPPNIVCELERLQERLCNMSAEIQTHNDADLKDLMMGIIPKLKNLEQQLSSFSEARQKSSTFTFTHETQIGSVDNGRVLPSEVALADRGIFREHNTLVAEDLVASGDYDDNLGLNTGALMNDLKEVLASISTQSNDLGITCKRLKQQNEKLLQMKIKVIHRPSSPEPGFAQDCPDNDDWSLLANPLHVRK